MKNIDITGTVMKDVASLEKRRITSFKRKFYGVMGVLFLLCVFVFWHVVRTLEDQRTFDLLELFEEDWEIIDEFWQDTVISFFQEMPQPEFAFGGIVIGAVLVSIVVTRKKRRIAARKEKEIHTYL